MEISNEEFREEVDNFLKDFQDFAELGEYNAAAVCAALPTLKARI